MIDNLQIALQITGIGMGLVFCAILMLWLLMVVIVKLTTGNDKQIANLPTSPTERIDILKKAAIAAVAAVIAQEGEPTPHEFPLPATALVSAWQAVMRTDILRKRGKTR